MKIYLGLLMRVFIIMLLLPISAFSLEKLDDTLMDDITGQAGVTIDIDVTFDIHMESFAWGDSDGVGGDTTGGWIGMSDLDIQDLRIRLNPKYAGNPDQLQKFTVDVGTVNGLYDVTGDNSADNGVSFVRIGLGTQLITMNSLTTKIALGPAINELNQVLGEFSIFGMELAFGKDSKIDIFAHSESGISVDLDLTFEDLKMSTMSWGDSDGLGTVPVSGFMEGPQDELASLTSPGYIGFRDLAIKNLIVKGQVIIDVATVTPAAGGLITGSGSWTDFITNYQNYLSAGGQGGDTGVFMQFKDFNIGFESFSSDFVLSSRPNLVNENPGQADTLFSFYMSNLNVNTNGWVAIVAR